MLLHFNLFKLNMLQNKTKQFEYNLLYFCLVKHETFKVSKLIFKNKKTCHLKFEKDFFSVVFNTKLRSYRVCIYFNYRFSI